MFSRLGILVSPFSKCCKKKPSHQDDQEYGSAAGNKESGNENRSNFKRQRAIRKKKNRKTETENPVPSTSVEINEDTAEGPSAHAPTPEGIASTGDDCSVYEPSSVTTNPTPASTPTAETIFKIIPQNEPTDSRNLSEHEHNGKHSSASSFGHTLNDDERIVIKAASFSVSVAETPFSPIEESTSPFTVKPVVKSKTTDGLVAGAHSSDSSTESCKTPVAPLKEVVITTENDDETKSAQVPAREDSSSEVFCSSGTDWDINGNNVEHFNHDEDQPLLGSEYETSSGEVIYSSESQSKMDLMANSMMSPSASPPIPPPRPNPPNTSTDIKRGKRALYIVEYQSGIGVELYFIEQKTSKLATSL